MTSAQTIAHGNRYPYEATDEWWNTAGATPPPPKDWAVSAARGILVDLKDRRGIKQGLEGLDEELRLEIVEVMADIIRSAAKGQS